MLMSLLLCLLTYTVAHFTAGNGTSPSSSTELFVVTTQLAKRAVMKNSRNVSDVTVSWLPVLPPRKIFQLATLPPRPSGYRNSWGPFFEEGPEPYNVTARVGSTVQMDCKIALLHDKTVSWLHRKGDVIHLLTVGRQAYSTDQRVILSFRYPNNWRLQITSVTERDDGLYECQVATHPPTVKTAYLTVTAPKVQIVDEKGFAISERYYKAGSQVELMCHASQVQTPEDNLNWWKANALLTKGITTNISEADGIADSVFAIPHVQKRHSGNYTCAVGQLTASSVLVHIVNGELPAAVHDGSSGSISSCFIATWLLTLCFLIGTDCALCCR